MGSICFIFEILCVLFAINVCTEASNGTSEVVVYHPGKRGAIGPPGIPGPPGNCTCEGTEKIAKLEDDYGVLEEYVTRIRLTSPETFCLLGMKDRSIPDNALSVSSREGDKIYARLDGSVGWYPSSNDPSRAGREWIMVDLGKIRTVTGVVTQGYPSADYWTKTFKVEHSIDGVNFLDVTKSDLSEQVFNGNSDRSTKVVNRFPNPVETRFVRIYPMSWHNHAFIRFDVIDC